MHLGLGQCSLENDTRWSTRGQDLETDHGDSHLSPLTSVQVREGRCGQVQMVQAEAGLWEWTLEPYKSPGLQLLWLCLCPPGSLLPPSGVPSCLLRVLPSASFWTSLLLWMFQQTLQGGLKPQTVAYGRMLPNRGVGHGVGVNPAVTGALGAVANRYNTKAMKAGLGRYTGAQLGVGGYRSLGGRSGLKPGYGAQGGYGASLGTGMMGPSLSNGHGLGLGLGQAGKRGYNGGLGTGLGGGLGGGLGTGLGAGYGAVPDGRSSEQE
uniref:Uncharacterized protein n=1 Tax=Knipowitschia caucasica TaxID=637954 RepID=A0AAV2KGD3_KNICA